MNSKSAMELPTFLKTWFSKINDQNKIKNYSLNYKLHSMLLIYIKWEQYLKCHYLERVIQALRTVVNSGSEVSQTLVQIMAQPWC